MGGVEFGTDVLEPGCTYILYAAKNNCFKKQASIVS